MNLKWLKRKSHLLYAAFGYLFSILVLLSALYWFLRSNGFDERNFLLGSGAILVMAFAWGYILANDLLAPKREMDARFEHLSREILHELNIPLSTINANTKMLIKKHLDEKSQKRLLRIESASTRLKRLYDELVYSINKELHSVESKKFSLHDILKERVDTFMEFNRNPFDLIESRLLLYTDKIGFEQMIDNLLTNAMKYSDKSTTISLYTKGEILYIQDRGIGMDETEIVKIFERYYQSDSKHRGEGIGLALVKTYCDEYNIDIAIESQKGRGTIVKLDLQSIIIRLER